MVAKMAEAGNTSMFVGLESGNQETLDQFQKKTSIEQQRRAVEILRENNIRIFGSFIIGEEHESPRMIKETIRFARHLKPDTCQFSLLTPYPGSRLYQNMEYLGKLLTKDWDAYDGAHLVFRNKHLTARTAQGLLRRAYLRFYLRLSNMPAFIKNLFTDPEEFKQVLHYIRSGFSIFRALKKDQSDRTIEHRQYDINYTPS